MNSKDAALLTFQNTFSSFSTFMVVSFQKMSICSCVHNVTKKKPFLFETNYSKCSYWHSVPVRISKLVFSPGQDYSGPNGMCIRTACFNRLFAIDSFCLFVCFYTGFPGGQRFATICTA